MRFGIEASIARGHHTADVFARFKDVFDRAQQLGWAGKSDPRVIRLADFKTYYLEWWTRLLNDGFIETFHLPPRVGAVGEFHLDDANRSSIYRKQQPIRDRHPPLTGGLKGEREARDET